MLKCAAPLHFAAAAAAATAARVATAPRGTKAIALPWNCKVITKQYAAMRIQSAAVQCRCVHCRTKSAPQNLDGAASSR